MSTPDFSGRKDKPVVVIGSLNMDLVMRTPRVPVGGETLHGHEFSTLPGGKGANQAVACARLGAKVAMIGQVGNDGFGTTLRDGLAADGIATSGVLQTSAVGTGPATGPAEDRGQTGPAPPAGPTGPLTPADIDAHAARIGGAAMLVLQLEVPMPVVQRAIGIAHAAGVPVLLNPGPASPLPEAVWSQIDILVPNESEATLLSGVEVIGVGPSTVVSRTTGQGASANVEQIPTAILTLALTETEAQRIGFLRPRRQVVRQGGEELEGDALAHALRRPSAPSPGKPP